MILMDCRRQALEYLIAAQGKTNIPLLGFNGYEFVPAGVSEDLGMYYMIPKLVEFFGISLSSAIDIFFYSLIACGFMIGLFSFMSIYNLPSQRAIACIGLLWLLKLALYAGDVYSSYAISIMAGVPFVLYLVRQTEPHVRHMIATCIVGFFLGLLHTVRSFSTLPIFAFAFIVILFYSHWSVKNKAIILACLCIGALLPCLYASYIVASYQRYAQEQPGYEPMPDKHPLWHAIYLGFGFLNNDLGIVFNDACGGNKALSIDSQAVYPSSRYEYVLKQEVIKLVKEHKNFVIHTIFAKIGILLFYLIRYANIGLIAAWYWPQPFILDVAFIFILILSSLFSILVMPYFHYSLGFIACCIIFNVVSINYALEKGLGRKIKNTLKKLK